MTILFAGLVLFFGVHSVPLFPAFRQRLIARMGASRFKGVYSLFAAAGFGLILYGMSRAPFLAVYAPLPGAAWFANLAMPVAFCLLLAAYMPNNFRRVIRNPMLSGITIWAFAHLLVNGDLASVALFASFGFYSIVDMLAVNRRAAAAVPVRRPLWMDGAVLAAGFSVFWIVRHFHGELFNMPAAK